MKKRFGKLSKREQGKVESEYHQMKPEDFDETMSRATPQTPQVVRLPHRLVEDLKLFAERQGKTEYQTLVTAWLEERLRKEANATR